MWINPNLAHPSDELLSENYGRLMKNGKILVKWYEGPTLPTKKIFRDERSTQENLNESDFRESHDKISSSNARTKHGRMALIETTSKLYFFDEQ